MSLRRNAALPLLAALVCALLLSCESEPDSPEAHIRALLERAEAAAEDRDAATLIELVSMDYTDAHGRDRKNVHGILGFYFLRNEAIHLLTRVQRITFPELDRAEATVLVAMAGRRIESVEELAGLRADLYRFDFQLTDEGVDDWKVNRADWKPAKTGDFL
jgi:hypothetical protein